MGLPNPESAQNWGGKLLVDRDGTEIGTCTEIFVDDATGLPEWAAADLSGGSAFVPLVDATESDDRVRVAVRHSDVVDAPSLGHGGHLTEAEEERLYRHYGIDVSREASASLLPAPEASSSPSLTPPPDVALEELTDTEAGADLDVDADLDAPAVSSTRGGRLVPAAAAGLVGALAVIASAIFWWRRRQLPPTRKELLAARAQAASLALGTRSQQLARSAAPVLRTGRKVSATTARQVTLQAGAAAERAAAQARVAAEAAAAQARVAARQAAALTATARTLRIQRVQPVADVDAGTRASLRRGLRRPFGR